MLKKNQRLYRYPMSLRKGRGTKRSMVMQLATTEETGVLQHGGNGIRGDGLRGEEYYGEDRDGHLEGGEGDGLANGLTNTSWFKACHVLSVEKRVQRRKTCKKHMNTHTQDKPYSCQYCNKVQKIPAIGRNMNGMFTRTCSLWKFTTIRYIMSCQINLHIFIQVSFYKILI